MTISGERSPADSPGDGSSPNCPVPAGAPPPKLRLTGDRNQCPTCEEYFNSSHAFEAHRTGRVATPERRCLTVEEMLARGFAKNKASFWITSADPRPYGASATPRPSEGRGIGSTQPLPTPLPPMQPLPPLVPRDCPEYDRCSANICPLDSAWQRCTYVAGEPVCLFMREHVKPGADARFARNTRHGEIRQHVVQVLAELGAHPEEWAPLLAAVAQAAKKGSSLDRREASAQRMRKPKEGADVDVAES